MSFKMLRHVGKIEQPTTVRFPSCWLFKLEPL